MVNGDWVSLGKVFNSGMRGVFSRPSICLVSIFTILPDRQPLNDQRT
jgi:hypothetical protein